MLRVRRALDGKPSRSKGFGLAARSRACSSRTRLPGGVRSAGLSEPDCESGDSRFSHLKLTDRSVRAFRSVFSLRKRPDHSSFAPDCEFFVALAQRSTIFPWLTRESKGLVRFGFVGWASGLGTRRIEDILRRTGGPMRACDGCCIGGAKVIRAGCGFVDCLEGTRGPRSTTDGLVAGRCAPLDDGERRSSGVGLWARAGGL